MEKRDGKTPRQRQLRVGEEIRHVLAQVFGRGELHDTPGVWVGDASAFPTATGVNPMVSIMVLAERTADRILAAA